MEGGALIKSKSLVKNQSGQTAVEYIFLIAVMSTLIVSFLGYIKNKYLGDALKCNASNSNGMLCKISSVLSPDTSGGRRFRYFPFKK
jgi:Flp pilus assembly pilin Flp